MVLLEWPTIIFNAFHIKSLSKISYSDCIVRILNFLSGIILSKNMGAGLPRAHNVKSGC